MPDLAGFELITRRLCLAKDTGHAGVLWGGNMMAWVDEAGAIYAARRTRNEYIVTKAFTEVDFKHQVRPFKDERRRSSRPMRTSGRRTPGARPRSQHLADREGPRVLVAVDDPR